MVIMDNNTLHISISNMDIYLGECFLKSITNRPPRLHNHPCYELVLVDGNDGARFIITPPLLEHIAVDPSYQNVTSLLFDFNSQDAGFFNVLRQIKSPISVYDVFDGALRIKSVKQLLNQKSFGFKEQIKAELNLFFVALVRALYSNEKLSENNLHFLDQERIMLLEEYFNIDSKYNS